MKKSAPIDAMFKELVRTLPRVAVVSPTEKLCTTEGCEIYLNGEFLYMDQGHIRRDLRVQTLKSLAHRMGLTDVLSRPIQKASVQPAATTQVR